MKTIYTLQDIRENPTRQCYGILGDNWYLAKPENAKSIWWRIKAAWNVLIGWAVPVEWY